MKLQGYKFTIAKPGFNKKYNREVSWEELRDTFMLYKRIPIIAAGDEHYDYIDPNKAIGFVDAKIDQANQAIEDEQIVLYDEKADLVPEEIRRLIQRRLPIPASLGYKQYGNMRKIDHILIGAKDPVFPDVGITAENGFSYEETEGMNSEEQEPKPQAPEKTEPFDPVGLGVMIGELKAEVAFLRRQLTEKEETPVASLEEEGEEEEVDAEEAEVVPEKAPPKPKTVVPMGKSRDNDGPDEDGVFRIST